MRVFHQTSDSAQLSVCPTIRVDT
eukprot:COSAG06_NODE_61162_length_268_cov_1.136095_1_plen_23_part_10